MVPGLARELITLTAMLCTLLVPQPFTAFAVTLPLVVFTVVVMLFVVEVPVQPDGRVQI